MYRKRVAAKELHRAYYFYNKSYGFYARGIQGESFSFFDKTYSTAEIAGSSNRVRAGNKKEKRRIVVDYGKNVLIYDSDIVYIEAQRNRTLLHTEKEILETNETLKYWEQELSIDDFLKVHKSYLVSLRYIRIVDSDGIILYGTEEKIPVSRRNMVLVKKAFYAYIKDHVKVM